MFTVQQIELAHSKIKSGAEFPKYIQEIKQIGVVAFETFVLDNHTEYFGKDGYQTKSRPKYEALAVAENCDKELFFHYLKIHQQGQTDYITFCKHCAETGIKKWVVSLSKMTCTYFDNANNEIIVEIVPTP
jgi:uncharacterized protein YbcV (DUF1398 family)